MFSESKTKQFETEEKMWEGKGIVENLFHLLWTKDPVFGTIPSLSIPDTIIYNYDEPIFWYFMKNNMIKKRNKDKLNNISIERSFLKRVPECRVVAQYFYKIKNEEKENNKENDHTKVIFEYFNAEEFRKFISTKNKPNGGNGILQKFLQPKGDYNFIIKTTWGPNLCLFEKKECIKKIGDLKYDLYERVFTYEAEDYHARTVPLRGYILPNKIEKLSYIIVQHVSNVSFERLQIERMVLNFKVDSQNKIWLLYCSFLQLKNTSTFYKLTQLINKIIYDFDVEEGVPKNVNTQITSIIKPLNLRKSYYCYNCCQNIDSQKILEVSYKTIIDSYEFDHEERGKVTLEAENKKRLYDFKNRNFHSQTINFFSKNITVPPILLHINPRLKEKEYVILKNDPNFLHKVTSVCEECFLIIAKGNIAGGDYNIQRVHTNESTNLFGVGRLRPEILKYRNKLTSRNIKYQSLIEDLRPDINSKRINHLISPTKLLTSDKLFDIDPNNNFGVHLYENMIDIPFRGSYRGSFKEKNSNKNIIPISPFAPLQLNEKNILENVNEYNNEKNSEIDEYEIKEEEEKKNYEKSMEEIKHIPKRFSLKLPLHNLENLQENNEASGNSQTKLDEKIEEKYTQINEKNTQNSCSITDRDSKYLSENHRKIFIPNLKNTTNSFTRLYIPAYLIPSKQSEKLINKETSSPRFLQKAKETKFFEESTKTHVNTFHTRNASLPSLNLFNTPPPHDFLSKTKKKYNIKKILDSPRDILILPKNCYLRKKAEEVEKPKKIELKLLKETMNLNCYMNKKRKFAFKC